MSETDNSDDTIVPEQLAIRVYENTQGATVILQERNGDEDDPFIVVQPEHIWRLIQALWDRLEDEHEGHLYANLDLRPAQMLDDLRAEMEAERWQRRPDLQVVQGQEDRDEDERG